MLSDRRANLFPVDGVKVLSVLQQRAQLQPRRSVRIGGAAAPARADAAVESDSGVRHNGFDLDAWALAWRVRERPEGRAAHELGLSSQPEHWEARSNPIRMK